MIQVQASNLVDADTVPTQPDQVWNLSRLFVTSWGENVTVANTWETDIVSARSSAEKRVGMGGKPVRAMTFTLYAFSQRESWQLLNLSKRMSMSRSLLPLYCDVMKVTGTADGRLKILGNPLLRRFFAGARAVLGRVKTTCAGFGPECDAFQTVVVSSVESDGLVLAQPAQEALGATFSCWPCIEADVAVVDDLVPWTGHKTRLQIAAVEPPGLSALPPWAETADLPLGLATFEDLPVFETAAFVNPEASSTGWRRAMASTRAGMANVYDLAGGRSRFARKWAFVPYDRASAVQVMTFWDACSGPLLTFFAVNPLQCLETVGCTATTLLVAASGPASDWNDYEYLAIRNRGESVQVTRITGFSRTGGVDRITFSPAVSLGVLAYATTAHKMRFDGENLQEKWQTTEHCDLSLEAVEVLRENDYSLLEGTT